MTDLLDAIFQLRSLSAGGEGVEWRFARPLPAWGWLFIALGCGTVAWWGYWRLLGPRPARIALASLRALLLALLAVLLAGPELVRENERTEKDWVVVLADRSASMTVEDVPSSSLVADGRSTREAQLAATLRGAWPTLSALAADRNVLFQGFDANAFDLRTVEGNTPGSPPSGLDLGEPRGRRTAIGAALDGTVRRLAGRAVAGIVLLSDGRSSDAPSRALLRQLADRRIPVFAVPLGSATPLPDLAVGRVEAPSAAFIGDIVPVTVAIEGLPADPELRAGVRVQLVDDATGLVLDERRPEAVPSVPGLEGAAPPSTGVTLSAKPDAAGGASWSVRLVLDTPDLTGANNAAQVRIELVDRPLRVVYFDGYPRWEYRYLKNLLLRERSIRSSTLLLAPDRRYLQEGTDVLDGLPRSQETWNAFDVVVLGDLRPALFSDEQLRQIRALVAERGAGLLWIGGGAATPGAWRGTPLADLLPFTLGGASGESTGPTPWTQPVLLRPGPAARRYGVLQLGERGDPSWPEVLTRPELGWNTLKWAQRIEPATLKPTAEVMAEAVAAAGEAAPLVMTMRYGAGRVVYVATDETWRFRYGRGETLPERFWIPLIRLLARESLGRSGKAATIEVNPERASAGQQVQVAVRLLDQSFAERRPPSITVRIAREGDLTGSPAQLFLKPEAAGDSEATVDTFTAPWLTTEPGVYTVDSGDPLIAGLGLEARVEVILPEDELRSPQTDHPLLTSLAAETGGQVLTPDRLAELPTLLPNREVRLQGTPDIETLWDKPVVWTLLMLLLTSEWIGRRVVKLS